MDTIFVPEPEAFGPEPWRLLSRSIVDGVRTSVRVLPVLGRGVMVRTSHQIPAEVDAAEGKEPQIAWSPPVMDEPTLLAETLLVEVTKREFGQIVDEKEAPKEMRIEVVARELIGLGIARERYQPKKGAKRIPDDMPLRAGMILPMEQRSMVMPQQPPMGPGGPMPLSVDKRLVDAANKEIAS
jgi:hypothetical protein